MNPRLQRVLSLTFLSALLPAALLSPNVAANVQQTVATSSGRTAAKRQNSDNQARINRVASAIETIEVGNGQPPIRLNIQGLMKAFNVPAFSVAVIDDYKIVWAKAYGVTEPGGKTPATPRTLFQAGSISKPVTAAGMLSLVQQGKLSLDEDVNKKLTTWKVPENELTRDQKVTLRRLASHSAGLTVHGFPGYDVDEKVPTLVEIFKGEKPANTAPIVVDFVPGSDERYSGGGVTIEQQLMMDVSGKPFPALMKELVLDKAGMTDSSYEQPLPPMRAVLTAGGTYADGKPVHGKWHIYPEMAAAGLWTTPTDLAKFAIEIALEKRGLANKVLSQAMAAEMLKMQSKSFGVGFGLNPDHPGEFLHNGADEGFQALLVMNYETGQGVALMANSDNGILVANEYLRGIAKEYQWKHPPQVHSEMLQLRLIVKLKGLDAALNKFDEWKRGRDNRRRPPEFVLNALGYDSLRAGQTEEAIRIFAKNVQEYPESSNVYDSLAEAYVAAGNTKLAIENYEKSVQLDPKNQNGVEQLKKLRTKQ